MSWNNTMLNEIQKEYNTKFCCFRCEKELKTVLHWYIGHKKIYFYCIPCFKKYECELK